MTNLEQKNLLAQTIKEWIIASKTIGFRIVAPYTLHNGDKSAECLAFLPHFGSPNGMVIGASVPPHFETDRNLIECAKANKMFWSFINLEMYDSYHEEVFKEALTDWEYFGPQDERPTCIPKQDN